MIKKIILIAFIAISMAEAIDLKVLQNDVTVAYPASDEQIGDKDWVAVFDAGTAPEWRNVIKWKWVKDLEKVNKNTSTWKNAFKDLAEGNYEARVFKNNNYDIVDSVRYTVSNSYLIDNNSINLRNIERPYYDKQKKKINVYLSGKEGRL